MTSASMTAKKPLEPKQGQNDNERGTLNDIIKQLFDLQSELSKYLAEPEKPEKPQEHERPEKPKEHERPERPEKPKEHERPERPEKPEKPEKPKKWLCTKVHDKVLEMISKIKERNGSKSGSQSSRGKKQTEDDERLMMQKLRSDIGQMKKEFEELGEFENHIGNELKLLPVQKLRAKLNMKKNNETSGVASQITAELTEMSRKIFNLRCEMPLTSYKRSSGGLSINYSQNAQGYNDFDYEGTDIYLPGLQKNKEFIHRSVFKEVKEKFKELKITRKLCLLSFAVFPENSEVKKTMLMYWWMGEGFIGLGKEGEKSVAEILKEFSTKRLIEPVKDDRKLKPNSYNMDPEVHSSVICLADSLDFFKVYGKEGVPTMAKSDRNTKVCLVKKSSGQTEAKVSKMEPTQLQTVFNASERFPDFTFKWFPLMASLRVLYLGRWERTAERHIEVESTELLENLKTIKKLKLVSFQGISRIEKLSDSICKLPKLEILDLRACYNLEVLPEEIDKLQKLIYLDVSECYMLDRMPKKIARLTKLEVLKGFVVSDAADKSCCTVSELKSLTSLRKLSINVNQANFKIETLIKSLEMLSKLKSLKVAWGATFPEKQYKEASVAQREPRDAAKGKAEKTQELKVSNGAEKTGTLQDEAEDKIPSKEEDGKGNSEVQTLQDEKGNRRNTEAGLEESKVSNGEDKTGTLQDEIEDKVNSKEEDGKGTSEVQTLQNEKGNRRNTEDGLEESKVHNSVEAMSQKSDEFVKEDKKQNHPRELKATNQQTQKDEIVEEDKKPSPAPKPKASVQKVGKMVNEDKKPSPTPELKAIDQKKTDDCKEDNDKVITAVAKPLDTNPGKARGSITEETRDPTSSDSMKPVPPDLKVMFDKMKSLIPAKESRQKSKPSGPKLPSSLRKLELECYPREKLPDWLSPENLVEVRKLSIKGGELRRISSDTSATKGKCEVEVLRLKYLDKFEAEWRDLQAMFPKLKLFEKYKCPKVTFCPSDGMGVWRSQTLSEKTQEMPQKIG